jgi:hypothetical protein
MQFAKIKEQSDNRGSDYRSCWCNECLTGGCDCTSTSRGRNGCDCLCGECAGPD